MDLQLHCCFIILLLFIPFIVTSAQNPPPSDCPVNMETLNYTNIQSQCKPPYEVQPCCAAYKELVCPFVDSFNGVESNVCAQRLFKYFDKLPHPYPDGLFANICVETKYGPVCPETPSNTSADASADQRLSSLSHELMILAPTFILILLRF